MSILLFPGQGAKTSDLISKNNPIAANMLEFSKKILGYDILTLTPEDLKDTKYSQPDLFIRSMILLELAKAKGLKITATAGHSLGQYSACVACEGLSFESGLQLVKSRAAFMSDDAKTHKGSMVACIGQDVETSLKELVKDFSKVFLANYNSSQQIVVAGDPGQIEHFVKLCKEKGVRCIPLAVAGAFHTEFMSESNVRMNKLIADADFEEPEYDFISNKTSKVLSSSVELREEFLDQIILPVHWTDISATVAAIAEQEQCEVYEVGNGNVLGKLVQIETGMKVRSIEEYIQNH